ncbi:MAG: YceI family protein [Ignavibacteriaceae bacterium]
MKNTFSLLAVLFFFTSSLFAQGFKVKASGEHTFDFTDKGGRNQATFFSTTPLEDINGLSNDVRGSVTIIINDIKSMKGTITVPVSSIKTGISLRDQHMVSEDWLNAGAYPDITFEIKTVSDIKSLEDNQIQAKVTGDFTVHGVTKETTADVTLTFLDASDKTKQRAPGDLLGVRANFKVQLSDYGINNKIVGQKVAEVVEVGVNMVGSNAK